MRTVLLILLISTAAQAQVTTHKHIKTAPDGSMYDKRTYFWNGEKVEVLPKYKYVSSHTRHTMAGISDHRHNPDWHRYQQRLADEKARREEIRRSRPKNQPQPISVQWFYYYYRPTPWSPAFYYNSYRSY